ncbi:hypothetical protein [Planobispora takensis]|uniref:Integral membrane protein n=1 Tax=Planobispora takensis TaxID=1367882 RepID=A0A8J3WRN8_9ACTN|nr:hypothetical protein [Planobispora takensis]GIH98327.1 hypothetical protein Pta02_03360 [Planobispora takensis]
MTAIANTTATAARTAPLLRLALRLDAVASGANGLLYVAAAALYGEMFGLPAAFLYPAGAFLLAFAAALLVLSSRPVISKAAAGGVIAVNAAWVVASVETLVAGWFPLTGLGTAMVIAQAVAVAAFAGLQFAGLRRSA